MNKEEQEESVCTQVTPEGIKFWRPKNKKTGLHRMNGPAIEYTNGATHWLINNVYVRTTQLELSINKAISCYYKNNDSIALVIKQISPILFQILIGNEKLYLFSLYNTEYLQSLFVLELNNSYLS